jgi:hypothetical protein
VAGSAPHPFLGLHNGYEGGLGPPHLQAVARAAALAVGFGLDLVLIAFPAEDAATLAARVDRDTGVAGGRGFASQLAAAGRIHLVPRADHTVPGRWPRAAWVGLDERAPAQADLSLLAAQGRIGLVMGLGPKGLPPQLKQNLAHHLELTGAGVPLETATVMGVVAERLRALRAGPPG